MNMRFYYFVKFSLLSVFIAGAIFSKTAFAQETPESFGLSVNPQIFELDVFSAETISETIKVKNLSNVAIPVKVKVVDFTAKEYSGETQFDESLQDPAISSRFWFKIENPDFILDSGEKRIINFEISVPENAVPGGHYSTIFFEPQLPSFYFKAGQPKVVPVVGVLSLLSVKTLSLEPEINKKLEVVEFSVPKEQRLVTLENFTSKLLGGLAQVLGGTARASSQITITKKSPSNFILRIKNNDIYHLKPSGKVSIYNIFGKLAGEAQIAQQTILPGKIREFPVEFSQEIPGELKWLPASISQFLVQNFFFGKYQAKLDLEVKSPLGSDENFKPDISTVLTFISFPWKFWSSFLTLFSLTLYFGIKYRRRMVLAVRTLIKG